MADKGGIEALNRSLKDIRGNTKLMGGVTVLLAGDFGQTLPVVPKETRADEVKSCIEKFNLWPEGCLLVRLCNKDLLEKHFAKEVISESGTRKHLLQNAVPSIFPHGATKHSLEVIDDDNYEGPPRKIVILEDITSNIVMHSETIISPPAATDMSVPGQSSSPYSSCIVSPTTGIQTPEFLSCGTPRKTKLREKLRAMTRKKWMKTSSNERYPTLEDFHEMYDKFLSEPSSGIVKTQAKLKKLKPLARRYFTKYKQFASTLKFFGASSISFHE
ncbi:uncharacterized protein [Leptinotarsa decemlineata]|uniref:uncharacterized protein n=1 Tax=Leptinotarsa decemlineata TaxID=7539 RepID=UPI003D30BA6D